MDSSKNLTQLILNDDEVAFKQLYRLYYEALCWFAYKYIGDKISSEDLVQDALIKLWEQRQKLSEVTNLKSYLYLIVKNSCLNFLEHRKVVAKHAESVAVEINLLSLQNDNLAFYDEDPLPEKLLMEAIEKLPKQSREIFKMKYLEGKRTKEIAEISNLSTRTVETHVYNALKNLRSVFNQNISVVVIFLIYFFSKTIK